MGLRCSLNLFWIVQPYMTLTNSVKLQNSWENSFFTQHAKLEILI
jgi:hypothetical protein